MFDDPGSPYLVLLLFAGGLPPVVGVAQLRPATGKALLAPLTYTHTSHISYKGLQADDSLWSLQPVFYTASIDSGILC